MDYKYLDIATEKENLILPESDKIDSFLLKNNNSEIIKAIDFINSKEKFLYIHGFMGTGKRQFINYICEFLNKDVILLEFFCKEATVCDDILLIFNNILEESTTLKTINLNAKITTLGESFRKNVQSIKKPVLIVLHSLDDVLENNLQLIKNTLSKIAKEENIKIIVSTRAMKPDVLGELKEDRKIFLKAFTKDIFKEYLISKNVKVTEKTLEDFYKYTRGYYYYVALTVKIIQAMQINLNEFLLKFNNSGLSFDSYLSATYINLIPTTIRNFFWFLRTVRHGLTTNALAIFELYDEFSIEYLKSNLMIFQSGETIYVQDYFLQKIDISIPDKTQIRLHKYIIGIYEKQLKEPLKSRTILISRQALRSEIEYHNQCITDIENKHKLQNEDNIEKTISKTNSTGQAENIDSKNPSLQEQIKKAQTYFKEKKYTEAIETYGNILDTENIDVQTVMNSRLELARIYKAIEDYTKSIYYYELLETYYKQNKEFINLSYVRFELADVYFKNYKNDRAVETIKKVIYSVDTPKSLFVNSCVLLGNIFSEINNTKEAYEYFKKAVESVDNTVKKDVLVELYFKYALAIDDKGNPEEAFDYYDKCITLGGNSPYISFAYSNMASCYFDNGTYDEAWTCFKKAYDLDKQDNNFDGIYYNASHLAKIALKNGSKDAYTYLMEAKKSAEFINEEFYILESTLALGDYYYNDPTCYKKGLVEYFKAKKLAKNSSANVELAKIERRINDMKIRMNKEDFQEVAEKYDNNI